MRICTIILCIVALGCNEITQDGSTNISVVNQQEYKLKIDFAKGFSIDYFSDYTLLKINSLSDKYPFYDSIILPHKQLASERKVLPINLQNIACQSSTHIAFLDQLDATNKVCGLSDIKYMPKDEIYDKIIASGIAELSNNDQIDIERLVNSNADLFLMYPFEWQSERYKTIDLPTLLVAEYLESTPIARLEWLKFFGCILDKAQLADSIFESVKNQYNTLVENVDSTETVLFNLPFKDNWDMPSGLSLTANLAKDAGLFYDVASKNMDNIVMSREKAWEKGMLAKYWIIIASRPEDFSLTDLIDEMPVYKEFPSVKSKKVLFCNTAYSSYFTKGVIEPHILLKDILFLTGKIDVHSPKYFKLLDD